MEQLSFDLSSYPTPTSLDDYPKTRLKDHPQEQQRPYNEVRQQLCVLSTLKGHLCKVIMIPHPRFECIITLDS